MTLGAFNDRRRGFVSPLRKLCVPLRASAVHSLSGLFHRRGAEERRVYAEKIVESA